MTIPINDSHAIPPGDEPADVTTVEYSVRYTHPMEGVVFTESIDDRVSALSYLDYVASRKRDAVLMVRTVTTTAWLPDSGSAPDAAPAKTHDLSIYRVHGNVVARVEREGAVRLVYLPDGVALDLGRVLAPLTPAQRQLLIDDLTGGEK